MPKGKRGRFVLQTVCARVWLNERYAPFQVKVSKQAAIAAEITTVLKAFHCELCDKQYQTVAQYDEHLNSVSSSHTIFVVQNHLYD